MKLYLENQDHKKFIDAKWCCNFVYAHGVLQNMVGYDILSHLTENDFDYKNDRIEDVVVVLPDGKEIESTLFLWHSQPNSDDEWYNTMIRRKMKENPVLLCHGLVVAKTDKHSLKYARKQYDKKPAFI